MDRYPKTYRELAFFFKKNLKGTLPAVFLDLYFYFFPFAGNLFFNRPSRKIKIIGVTGTDGKSSTVIFIARILKEAGYKVGFFSSVLFSDGDKERHNKFKMTMPGRFFMQKFLSSLIKNKCDFAVIEVTSEGIKQKRHLFIDFDVAVCTNIKPEHIESHGGFLRYKEAKAELFKNLKKGFRKDIEKIIVVNGDDVEVKSFLDYEADVKITFGTSDKNYVKGKYTYLTLLKNIISVFAKEEVLMEIKNGGPFILENIIAAAATSRGLGIGLSIIKSALENNCFVPGRFEIISESPPIVVDYAHTVNAVEKLLSFVRQNWGGEIIHVFGAAGGGRDKWKRVKLAELSEKYSDFSILTEENSFDEPTENILTDILKGFKNKERTKIILDRREAVAESIKMRNNKILLLFTGKGCETVIAGPLGRKTPYNERETICRILGL